MKIIGSVQKPRPSTQLLLPSWRTPVSAGLPTPMDEYLDEQIDLIACLIKHPDSTCVLTVTGDSMDEDRIHPGDILIVDRDIEPIVTSIVIVMVDGEFTVKRLSQIGGRLWLVPSNKNHSPLEISQKDNCRVWGVVQWILHKA